ncbi:hypothetical protein AGMMS50256_36800 [Betaproteobacteria bacterium]|nr:hypothetical protein AGMMS50256_36800 [Betaproteobacteria bacterium]
MPDDIKSLLSKVLNGKDENERDEILDNILDIVNSGEEITDIDIKEYLEDLTINQTKNLNEQAEIDRKNSVLQLASSLENLD